MTLRMRLILTTVVVLALGGLFALLPVGARSLELREVVLTARQMSFRIGDASETNPVIRMAPGEKVRITLISADPGFEHDFAVTAWNVKSPVLHGLGRTSIVVQAPDRPGRAAYVCSSPASMMNGIIEVEDRRD